MDIKFICTNPACQQHLAVDESCAGRSVQCPKCGTTLQVPTLDMVALASAQERETPVAADTLAKKLSRNYRHILILLAAAIVPSVVVFRACQRVSVERTMAPGVRAAIFGQKSQGNGNAPAPNAKFIVSLLNDAQGTLWAGTEGDGIFRYDRKQAKWAQFTTTNGLGDDNVYALACDQQGRVWAGELNHGVAVFNGAKWTNYDVLDGPIGERIFRIAVCPTDGDIWMATSGGLTRYSVRKNIWQYYTRADGLPSDQANALAFDRQGNLYVGTQCDGIAIAFASDDYKAWSVIHGPAELPLTATGKGLPTDLINDLLVDGRGNIYAATCAGLAYSTDHGLNWTYIRGRDFADKVKGLANAPTNWTPPTDEELNQLLPEDYVTCLAEDGAGHVCLGFRQQGYATIELTTNNPPIRILPDSSNPNAGYVRAILPGADDQPCIGTYGNGFQAGALSLNLDNHSDNSRASKSAAFPTPAKPPNAAGLEAMVSTIENLTYDPTATLCPNETNAAYLGQDWRTLGDWLGRYGRQGAKLSAMAAPFDHNVGWDWHITIAPSIGPHHNLNSPDLGGRPDSLRYWSGSGWVTTTLPKALYSPVVGHRRITEWDDHGETYPMTYQGPDIWVRVGVPEGVFRVAFYFVNYNAQIGNMERMRDYLLELKPYVADPNEWDQQPTLARSRVEDFFGGEYQTFIVTGPADYNLKIGRNYSFNTMCEGAFVDRLIGPGFPAADNSWLPYMEHVWYEPPPVPALNASNEPADLLEARDLWNALDNAITSRQGVERLNEYRLLAYRTALSEKAPEALLFNWRWQMPIWTAEDRTDFWDTVQKAYLMRSGKMPLQPETAKYMSQPKPHG
jgi:sugar lactone lactonase YvrE